MANKNTMALSQDEYKNIIELLQNGFTMNDGRIVRPNKRIATILVIEANLGIRIGDVLALRFSDIVRDGDRYRLDIIEQKTEKPRTFTVPAAIRDYLEIYMFRNRLSETARLFPISNRAVQKQLKKVCDHLGYVNISTHSFRKFFATNIYVNSGYNINLVRQLLQHSSTVVTQRYIGVGSKELEEALVANLNLM